MISAADQNTDLVHELIPRRSTTTLPPAIHERTSTIHVLCLLNVSRNYQKITKMCMYSFAVSLAKPFGWVYEWVACVVVLAESVACCLCLHERYPYSWLWIWIYECWLLTNCSLSPPLRLLLDVFRFCLFVFSFSLFFYFLISPFRAVDYAGFWQHLSAR